jgi:hypothetical protein
MVRRVLEPFMKEYIDKKLVGNGLAKHAIENDLPRVLLVEAVKSLVGITEATGRNDGKMIKGIQETVGGASGEPYCAGGVMTGLAYVEAVMGVKSPIPATELAQDIWWKTPKSYRVKLIPLPGAIAVWADYSGSKRKMTGHTEIVIAAANSSFQCVGFNTSGTTSPGSTVNRDGNGVFYTVRSYKPSKSRKLLGFIKPF